MCVPNLNLLGPLQNIYKYIGGLMGYIYMYICVYIYYPRKLQFAAYEINKIHPRNLYESKYIKKYPHPCSDVQNAQEVLSDFYSIDSVLTIVC